MSSAPLRFDPVALGVLDREIAQGDLVRCNQQPLARALLSGEVQHAGFHPRAAQGHAVDIKREPVGQHEPPRAQLHHIAWLGDNQRLLQAPLGIGPGGNRDGLGMEQGQSGPAPRPQR